MNHKTVLAYLQAVLADGEPREIRYIHPQDDKAKRQDRPKIASFYVNGPDDIGTALRDIERAERNGYNCYVTVNPLIDPDRIAFGEAAKDQDIRHRTFIPIDIDRKKTKEDRHKLATPEQTAAAMVLACDFCAWFSAEFPDHAQPIWGCSGNGYLVLLPCDIEHDASLYGQVDEQGRKITPKDANYDVIHEFLSVLAEILNTEAAEIDLVMGNAARICRILGTENRKRDSEGFNQSGIESTGTDGRRLTIDDLRSIIEAARPHDEPAEIHHETVATASDATTGTTRHRNGKANGFVWHGTPESYLRMRLDKRCGILAATPAGKLHIAHRSNVRLLAGLAKALNLGNMKDEIKKAELAAVTGNAACQDENLAEKTFEWAWNNGYATGLTTNGSYELPTFAPLNPEYAAILKAVDAAKSKHSASVNGSHNATKAEADDRPDNNEIIRSTEAEDNGRPVVLVTPSVHVMIDDCLDILADDPDIYVSGRDMVTISHGMPSARRKGLTMPGDAPVALLMTANRLFERLSRKAVFARQTKDGKVHQEQPPERIMQAIANRGHYPAKFRRMRGIVEWPILRPDGTIHDTPGYDPVTEFVLIPSIELAPIPDHPTQADAVAAANRLFELVKDFPFKPTVQDESAAQDGTAAEIESKAHSAAWLAALLTIVGRPAIEGPCPGFLVDGNAAATGKSKLARLPALIATGREPGLYTWPKGRNPTDCDEEVRKLLLTVAAAALPVLVFDNVPTGTAFGCAALDLALTSSVISGRRLKSNELIEAAWHTVTLATGINVTTAADSNRRIWRIRLETDLERPENRRDFEIDDIEAHALANRAELLRDALLILRAHAAAGRPSYNLDICDFRSWHSVVRDAVYFAAGVDVNAVRVEQQGLDQTAAAQTELLLGLAEMFPPSASTERRPGESSPFAAKDILDRLKDGGYDTLRAAIESPRNENHLPTANTLGKILNASVGTVRNGLRLRRLPIKGRAGVFKLENLSKPAQDHAQPDRVF